MRLTYRFVTPLTVLLTTTFALPATSAEDVFAQAFTIPSEGRRLLRPHLRAAQLKAHPRQKTVALQNDMVQANPDDRPNTAERFELGVSYKAAREPIGSPATRSPRRRTANELFPCRRRR